MKYFFVVVLLMTLGVGCTEKTSNANLYGQTTSEKKVALSEVQKTGGTSVNSSTTVSMTRTLPNQKDLASTYTHATFKTNKGDITVELYAKESPVTVNNFLNLAESGYYAGTTFHRVIKDFMIQGGDLNSKSSDRGTHGRGGPGYTFGDEFNTRPLVRGSLAMANAGPNTNGSQFFIVTAEATPWLDGRHTNFGYVTSGMEIVRAIEAVETDANDNPVTPVIISSIELAP